jgi:hypothetical protein
MYGIEILAAKNKKQNVAMQNRTTERICITIT